MVVAKISHSLQSLRVVLVAPAALRGKRPSVDVARTLVLTAFLAAHSARADEPLPPPAAATVAPDRSLYPQRFTSAIAGPKPDFPLYPALTVALGFGAGVAGGAWIAALGPPDRVPYHRTLGESFAGSLVGSSTNLLLFTGVERFVDGEDSSLLTYLTFVGALAGPPLTALGAYGASESFYQGNPNANYGVALKGAYLGVGIGLATHVALCALTKNPFVRDLSLSLATGFAGGMSSWAIHNAGTLVR